MPGLDKNGDYFEALGSLGFGFVEMATEEAAEAAIGALNGRTVDNRQIRVDKAKPRRDRGRRRTRLRSGDAAGLQRLRCRYRRDAGSDFSQ